jgi:hypothetical protein
MLTEEKSGERIDRLGVKTRRHGALTPLEAAKHGRAAMGRGALGHETLQTWPVRTVARQARHRAGCRGSARGEARAASGSAAAASDTGWSERVLHLECFSKFMVIGNPIWNTFHD